MKRLFFALLLTLPLLAQEDDSFHVGVLARKDRTGAYQPSFDSMLLIGKFALTADYTTGEDWLVTGRTYFWRVRPTSMPRYSFHLGMQEGIRRAGAVNPKDPWVLQTGLLADVQHGRNRLIAGLSVGDRLKTTQTGYVISAGFYHYLGNGWAVRSIGLFSHLVAKPGYQIGVGFNYVIPLRKK